MSQIVTEWEVAFAVAVFVIFYVVVVGAFEWRSRKQKKEESSGVME